jgi:hypothetical protein
VRRYAKPIVGVLIIVLALCYACFPFGRQFGGKFPGATRVLYGLQQGNPACLPLRNDGIEIVVSVPAIGCACTPDELPNLWRYHHAVYVRPDGSRLEDNVENNPYSTTPRQQTMPYPFTVGFIGSQEDANSGVFGAQVDLARRCDWMKT